MSFRCNITPLPEIMFLDFDGVLTDNTVYLNELGQESVRCHRGDGLAFDALRKLEIPTFIVSTEKNPVVSRRAEKLKVPCVQNAVSKYNTIESILQEKNIQSERACFVGNDINDLKAMMMCGYKAAPSDSHPDILEIANVKLASCGGMGVIRELLESHFNLNLTKILYP